MTYPPPPQAPKKLQRSRSNRMLGGVCGGVADYLNLDPTLVRVLTAILTVITGVPVVIYLVMLFVVPEEGTEPPRFRPSADESRSATDGAFTSAGPSGPGFAATPPSAPDDTVWGSEGAPWEQRPAEPVAPTDPEPVAPFDPLPPAPSDPVPPAPSDPEAPGTPPEDQPRPGL